MSGKPKTAAVGVVGFALVLAFAIGGVGVSSAAAQAPGQKSGRVLQEHPGDQGHAGRIDAAVHAIHGDCARRPLRICHDDNAQRRELDTKPTKATARRMMQMVADINRTLFGGRNVVTCLTCHLGSTKPKTVLPYNDEEGRVTRASQGQTPTVDQLIDRYIAALGGAENIGKISSRVLKGTVANYGHLDQVHSNERIQPGPRSSSISRARISASW